MNAGGECLARQRLLRLEPLLLAPFAASGDLGSFQTSGAMQHQTEILTTWRRGRPFPAVHPT